MSNHVELDSSFDSNYGYPASRSEYSPSFTYDLSRIKIDFKASSFEKSLSTFTSNLELLSSTDFEEHVLSFDPKDLNLFIEIEPFVFPDTSKNIFKDDLSTSSTLECLIQTSSNEANAELNIFLNSAAKDSTASLSLSSEKSFAPASRDHSSKDRQFCVKSAE